VLYLFTSNEMGKIGVPGGENLDAVLLVFDKTFCSFSTASCRFGGFSFILANELCVLGFSDF
jgi:hypothetical protein